MRAAVRGILFVATMIGASMLASQAAWAVACPATVGQWAGVGTCTDDDKDYTFISSTLPTGSGFAVTTVPLGTTAIHTVSLNFGSTLAPGTYSLEYHIAINILGPTFGAASLDSTVPAQAPGVTVTKDIFDITGTTHFFTLTSSGGAPAGPDSFPAGVRAIDVKESFSVTSNGIISAATNTYTELNFSRRLSDSHEPGSVIVFPKFIRGFVTPPGDAPQPRTEFELGVVCPSNADGTPGLCPEQQKVKIRFHYVCGAQEGVDSQICHERDFDAQTTVNGKLVFNSEGAAPGNFITPFPPCNRGYLIAWVIDTSDRPIKFDGLIGNAILRESATAVSGYNAIPIQADPALATGALISLVSGGGLAFDGLAGHYQALPGVIYTDVAYDRTTPTIKNTFLTFLTMDVNSNRPNDPTFVDMNFYNASEALLSTSTEFICWGEIQLSSQIDGNLTVAGMGSRKGVLVTEPAVKINAFTGENLGPVTLLGLVETLDGPTGVESEYILGVSNDSRPVPTTFFPN